MNPVTASSQQHPAPDPSGTLLRREILHHRDAVWLDYIIFFVGIPAALAFIFSLVGIRLIAGMPYLDGLLYMNLHMFIAWWSVSMGAWLIKFMFRSWQPPVVAISCLGFLIVLIPTVFPFQALGEIYASMYPSFAAARADEALPSWTLDYILHFIRYSIPALPLFLAGVYIYRLVTGVDWYGYAVAASPEARNSQAEVAPGGAQPQRKATASLITNTQLADHAELLAIKAEQHYIQIWSDRGTDMVRYRFRDIPAALAECNGVQVHRSWWVNLDQVQSHRQSGRALELVINDDLIIPVSLSYRNSVLDALAKRDPAAA